MTREELSEIDKRIAAAVVRQEEAIARQEAAVARQEAIDVDRKAVNARYESAVAKHEEISARIAARMEEREAKLEQREEEVEDLKTFIRNMNLRTEKLIQAFDRRIAEFFARQEKRDERLAAEAREGREESRAQTQALLRLIDRFPPPSAPAQ